MPGVNKEGLEISVENNELTIVGRRSLPAGEGTVIHRESRPENYRRAFELDPSIDANKISAKIDQGVVTLTLPKAEHVKPRKDHCFLKERPFLGHHKAADIDVRGLFILSLRFFLLANCRQRSN